MAKGELKRFELSKKAAKELAEKFLFEKAKIDDIEIEIVRWYGIKSVFLPYVDSISVFPQFPMVFDYNNHSAFTLNFLSGTKNLLSLNVRPYLKRFGLAVIAEKPINKGQKVSVEDVNLVKINLNNSLNRTVLQKLSQVTRKVARVDIGKGEIIQNHMIKALNVVNVGDSVDIVVRGGGYEILAKGKAKGNGAIGDVITVINISSKKVLKARVIAPKKVMVDMQK